MAASPGEGKLWIQTRQDPPKLTFCRSLIVLMGLVSEINTRLVKAGKSIVRLSVIWKSDLSDKIKHIFSKQQSFDSTIWMHHIGAH